MTDKPPQPGFYWVRYRGSLTIVRIVKIARTLCVEFLGGDGAPALADVDTEIEILDEISEPRTR